MIDEHRRRAYLQAMEVDLWLPRGVIPNAAPARAPWQRPAAPPAPERAEVLDRPAVAPQKTRAPEVIPVLSPPPKPVPPAPAQVLLQPPSEVAPPPRFALQLARAGSCLLLVDLPTGEALQSRDPGYLLLKDLLRAAGLPAQPSWIGEPVIWPAYHSQHLDRGPQAAKEYLREFVAVHCAETPNSCLWLIGLDAIRYLGDGDQSHVETLLQVPGLGPAWALPGLDTLIDEPQRKASLWRAMRQVRSRWVERRDE